MKIKIKIITFSIILVVLFFVSTVLGFLYFYQTKKEETSTLIIKSLNTSITEFSFVLVKFADNYSDIVRDRVNTLKPLLERKAATDDFINAVAIFDENGKVLLSTSIKNNKFPENTIDANNREISETQYRRLIESDAIKSTIGYYDGLKRKHIYLVMYIDKPTVKAVFDQGKNQYIVMFLIFPFIMMLVSYPIVFMYMLKPMKELERYAYYQNEIPGSYDIVEIDNLKDSIVDAISRLEAEKADLYNLARTDSLSGIGNRKAMEEYLEAKIVEASQNNTTFAVLFMDIDNFKTINDSIGHGVGDKLIKETSKKLSEIMRRGDFIARIGGDEFMIVLNNFTHKIGLVKTVERIEEVIRQNTFIIEQNKKIGISASIGIAIYPQDGETMVELMKHSDIALYDAKRTGKGRYKFFTESLDEEVRDYLSLLHDMKVALSANEYVMYYQPQNDVKTFKINGVEALIRWKHSQQGFISPAKFIPIAEQAGFINELGMWILETVIAQKKTWECRGIDLKVSVNVSATQILTSDFIEYLKQLLDYYQINRHNLCIEITEYVFVESTDYVIDLFDQIKKLGVEIHLDDFGTGYSSLSFLKKIPLDVVKVDKAFVDDTDTPDGRAFFETIVNMCNVLGLPIIAEGVETHEQYEFLKSIGAATLQGYLYSPPIPAEKFEELFVNCAHNLNSESSCAECNNSCRVKKMLE